MMEQPTLAVGLQEQRMRDLLLWLQRRGCGMMMNTAAASALQTS